MNSKYTAKTKKNNIKCLKYILKFQSLKKLELKVDSRKN